MFVSSSQNRTGYFQDTNTYAPSTWYSASLTQWLTNQVVAGIHQDAANIPGKHVWSNSLAEVWVRPFGGLNTKSNTILVINSSTTNKTITISNEWLNLPSDVSLDYSDAFFGTNVASDAVGSASVSLSATNVLLLRAYPSTGASPNQRGQWQVISARDMTYSGTGVSENTLPAYGPAPFYNTDGIAQTAANTAYTISFAAPQWASKATVVARYYSAYAGSVAWTNSPGWQYYNQTTRVTWDSSNDAAVTNQAVITTSGQANWATNIFGLSTVTGDPRIVYINGDASSNASARYIIGPMLVKWE